MKQNSYLALTSLLFGIICIIHLLRALNQWPVEIDNVTVPLWASWAGFILAGYLAYTAYNLKSGKR